MRFGSFLMGGLIGAAAVMYFSGRNKPMFWSAGANSDLLGSVLNLSSDKKSQTSQSKNSFSDLKANENMNVSSKANTADKDTFAGGSEDIQRWVQNDSEAKTQIDAILASNAQKKEHQAH